MSNFYEKEILNKLKNNEITADVALKLYKEMNIDNIKSVNKDNVKKQLIDYLALLISKETKVQIERINTDSDISSYGIDSIMILNLNEELEEDFSGISKTLFYEYKNINDIADYIITEYKDTVREKFGKIEETIESSYEENKLENDKISEEYYQEIIDDEIAIIGISGKYPEASNLDEFWENIKRKKSCIKQIPKDRWDCNRRFTEDKNEDGKVYTKWGGFINDVDKFDSLLFNISPKEAKKMDPQERIFMENAWNTIEDAGYTKESLKKYTVGVFVGVMYGQYQILAAEETQKDNVIATSSFYSAIANRVSYFFDFKGPSVAIDTMCSSSITAIYLACESIKNGESDLVLAGGVNLNLHESKYIYLSQEKFASSDGKCRSFGKGGDGYVPGEGVGSILLKKLSKAKEDGDNIYAIVKGSAISHAGKSNGYSVPDPNAQASVINKALEKSKINPERIGYLEMHGTGTSLGDPIEIAGITKVFNKNVTKDYCCPIGSVKSNIGHLESAAGIAAITKVILQMKKGLIAPSINAEELNPNINFNKSHFYVQRELERWDRHKKITEEGTIEYPRVAGISAFGAGGSNAHIILEEYIDEKKECILKLEKYIVVLSADTKEQVVKEAENLLNHIENNINLSLKSIAYTLQIGRTEMDERLAIVAYSIEDLIEKLNKYIKKEQDENILSGNIRESLNDLILKYDDVVNTVIRWINGEKIDWEKIYNYENIKKVSLPTYPFKRIRHWIDIKNAKENNSTGSKLNELVHRNTSNLKEQKYSSKFTGEEFYFKDHKIKLNNILPAAAQIEMMRFVSDNAGEFEINNFKELVWNEPIFADNNEINISIIDEGNNLYCEIWSYNNNKERIVYSKAIIEDNEKNNLLSEKVDVDEIINRCTNSINGKEFYKWMRNNGLEYGESFRVVKNIMWDSAEVISEIEVTQTSTLEGFKLKPNMIDGAMQSISGFLFNDKENKTYVPYSIDKIEFNRELNEAVNDKCFAYVKKVKNELFDIDLIDYEGNVFFKIFGLKVYSYTTNKNILMGNKDLRLLSKTWIEKENKFSISSHSNDEKVFVLFTGDAGVGNYPLNFKEEISPNMIEVKNSIEFTSASKNQKCINYNSYDDIKKLFELLSKEYKDKVLNVLYLNNTEEIQGDIDKNLDNSIYFMFNITKAILAMSNKNKANMIYLCKKVNSINYPMYSAIESFMKVSNYENSRLKAKLVEVDKRNLLEGIDLIEEFNNFDSTQVRFIKGYRYISTLGETCNNTEKAIEIRDNGTYVITGGNGGLGSIISNYLCKKSKINLVLIGRSELTYKIEKEIDKLKGLGSNVQYIKCDITDIENTKIIFNQIRKHYGEINGILHSAGVISDSFIINKELDTLKKVISPKVYGTYVLDRISKKDNLDFFICFSSIATVLGNIGQSDYCYGNEFMNDFSIERNNLVNEGKRRGTTISVNWPLWENGGMELNESNKEIIRKNTGLDSIEISEGIAVFEDILSKWKNEVVVFKGNYEVFNNKFISNNMQKNKVSRVVNKNLSKKLEGYIKKVISDGIGLNIEDIRIDDDFNKFGLSSIMMMNIIRSMNNKFNNIPSTLFFDNNNVSEISKYLLENNYDDIIKNFNEESIENHTKNENFKRNNPTNIKVNKIKSRFERRVKKEEILSDEIAIIGVSGKYPEAENLDEFWNNLISKKNCITEIPKDRWNWSDYYSEERGKKGHSNSKWGGFIKDIDKFDPLEFNISPKEAKLMDPQERLFLEIVSQAMEDSGYTRKNFEKDRVGVFVGAMYSHYQLYASKECGIPSSNLSSIANRVSYIMNFNGPSMAIDTMCSSSLTSIHLACQSIKLGECNVAVAGGVNLSVHPNKYLLLSQGLFLSSEGKCRSFGEGGDGYVPGEGVGAVILKPLKDAIRDKDNIYAVIKSTGINHGGKTNGYSVPSTKAQSEVIRETIKKSGVNPRSITYIEAHGTGTSLGDPIEIQALNNVFREYTEDKEFCSIGSVKSNIGHLESVAGIVSLTKVLLQFKNKVIVPSLYSENPNNKINFKDSPFRLETSAKKWDATTYLDNGKEINVPRTAAISAFGAGGSNAHIILQEWNTDNEDKRKINIEDTNIITLSGRKEEQIKIQAKNLLNYLDNRNNINLDDVNNIILKDIEEKLKNIVSDVLKIDLIDFYNNQSFLELGIEIRDLIEIKDRIFNTYSMELDLNEFSQYSTINELAQYVKKDYKGNLNKNDKTNSEVEIRKLQDVAYTLWEGREKRQVRLAIVTNSMDDLKVKLKDYINEEKNIEDLYFSEIDNQTLINCFDKDENLENIINTWVKNEEFNKIAQLWSGGVGIDWNLVFSNSSARKISLPKYPLLKERYWIEDPSSNNIVKEKIGTLLDNIDLEESSKFDGVVFNKTYKADDILFLSHKVNGESILPGAASLEMILEGIKSIYENINNQFKLKNLIWNKAIRIVKDECKIKIYLKTVNDTVNFKLKQIIGKELITCVSGECLLGQIYEKEEKLNINYYKDNLKTLIGESKVYETLKEIGLDYGDYLKGIKEIYSNSKEELSYIKVPKDYNNESWKFIAPINIIDSAFQSIIGIQGNRKLSVPLKVEELIIIKKIETEVYVYCKNISPNTYDMYICDLQGEICVKLTNLMLEPIGKKEEIDTSFTYSMNWTEKKCEYLKIEDKNMNKEVLIFYSKESEDIVDKFELLHINDNIKKIEISDKDIEINENYRVINKNNEVAIDEYIKTLRKIDFVYLIEIKAEDKIEKIDLSSIEKAQEGSIISLFRIVKSLIDNGYKNKLINLKIITNNVYSLKDEKVNPYYSYLYGFSSSLSKENKAWNVQAIDIDYFNNSDIKDSILAVYNMPNNLLNKSVVIRKNKYFTMEINKVSLMDNLDKKSFVEKGVYVIIGGTGGIGSELSFYIAKKYNAKVVLIGRKAVNSTITSQIDKVKELGGDAIYIEGDMTNVESMEKALEEIKIRFGSINGVIHSAIVLKDRLIELMNENELRSVLKPKVSGSVVIANVFKNENLDFMMFFSSAQSIAGSVGQSNYSGACTFKDAFALYLEKSTGINVRIINWGYWGEVGIVSSEDYVNSLNSKGVYSISVKEGLSIIEKSLKNEITQIIPVKADKKVLKLLGKRVEEETENDSYKKDNQFNRILSLKGINDKLEKIIPCMILIEFQNIDIFKEEHQLYKIGELKNKLNLVKKYEELFDEILDILEEAAFIIKDNDMIITTSKVKINLVIEVNDFKNKYVGKDIHKELKLVNMCVGNLIDILSGNKKATDVMFSGSSVGLVEGIYKGNIVVDYFNEKVGVLVENYLKNNINKNKKMRIIEVGAGTGGTTKTVLEKIEDYSDSIEYYYTDISNRFLKYGKNNFGEKYDFLKFNILNIEEDPLRQGFEANSFDIVIATNVLHATKNIDTTISGIEKISKSEAILVINEVVGKRNFLTVTFGLLDGWWLSEDKRRICGSPLLSRENWFDLLKKQNFEVVMERDIVEESIGYQNVIVGINRNKSKLEDIEIEEVENFEEVPNIASIKNSDVKEVVKVDSKDKNINVKNFIEDKIVESIVESLEIKKEEIDKNRAFSEYGVDSITGLDLVKKINKKLNIALRTTVIFDYSYISKLTEFINTKFKEQIKEEFFKTQSMEE